MTELPSSGVATALDSVLGPIKCEIEGSKRYIDIIHAQIGGSLAESEREVLAAIEQISVINAKTVERRERIRQCLGDGQALIELASLRSESDRADCTGIDGDPFLLDLSGYARSLFEYCVEMEAHQADIVDRLSKALGHIQFQDVMRQRMEHVQEALLEMRDHLQNLASHIGESHWSGSLELTFDQILESHLGRYRMASQAQTHRSIADGDLDARKEIAAIELF